MRGIALGDADSAQRAITQALMQRSSLSQVPFFICAEVQMLILAIKLICKGVQALPPAFERHLSSSHFGSQAQILLWHDGLFRYKHGTPQAQRLADEESHGVICSI